MAVRFVTVGDDLLLPSHIVIPGGYSPPDDPEAWDIRNWVQGSETWDTTGTTDVHAILARAILGLNALYLVDGIPRQVYIPNGTYRISQSVAIKSGAGMYGQSERGVRFMLENDKAFIGNTVEDVTIENLTVDGINQTCETYDIAAKGFFIRPMKDSIFRHVTIQNTIATGFGCDSLDGVRFDHCSAINCGRGVALFNVETIAGASGFGLGAGNTVSGMEPVSLIGCSAIGCGNFGIFVEHQPGHGAFAPGYKIIGCHMEGNLHGFGDAGSDGTIFIGNSVISNRATGVWLNSTPLSSAGKHGLVANNLITKNPIGISIRTINGPYTVESNEVMENTSNGIDINGIVASGLTIRGNRIHHNTGVGLNITAKHTNLTLEQNRITNNTAGDITMSGAQTVSGLTVRLNDLRTAVVSITQNVASGLTVHDNLGWTYP